MKPETKFQTKFIRELRRIPGLWSVKISQKTISGTPDLLCCLKGRFIAIELKADSRSKVSHLQQYTLRAINGAGGLSFVCTPENQDEVIRELMMVE